MNIWFLRLVRFECAIIAIYHVLLGVVATLVPDLAAELAPVMYGISLEVLAPLKPEYLVIIRFMGAFAITFGLLMAFAAWDPLSNGTIVLGGAIFFSLRILDRILGADTLISSFQTTPSQNLAHILLMGSFVIILGIFSIYRSRVTSRVAAA